MGEVEGHVVGFGLDSESGKHLDQLIFDDIILAPDEGLS